MCVRRVIFVCVLCEEASAGCSSISGDSSCLECSRAGVVCPSAALATWTCDLNTHIRTCTQHHSHWPGFRTECMLGADAEGCLQKAWNSVTSRQ